MHHHEIVSTFVYIRFLFLYVLHAKIATIYHFYSLLYPSSSTATASFIGMVIFVAKIPSPFEVSWSLGLTVVGMTLFLIAGTLMIPDAFEPDGHADYYGYQKQGRPSSRGITPITFQDAARWGNY